MKRIISVILALAMILILPPFSTVAADQGPYYAIEGEKTVKSGETVSLKVAIYNNPGIISLRFRVTYDENLELVEIVDGKLLSGMSEPSPNVASPYILKWADYRATANNTANGVVVTLVFRAKANLVSATAAVGIEHVEGRNANGSKVAFTNTTTTISITCGHVNVRNDAGTQPDCESAGVTAGVYCEDCKNWISGHENMAATGHKLKYIDNGDGTHDQVCQTCGDVEIDGKAHDFVNDLCICGAEKPVDVVSRNVAYTVRGNVVTVKNSLACKLGYWNETTKNYVEIPCTANGDGSYSFTVPEGIAEVLLVVIGDVDGNGSLEKADNDLLGKGLLPKDYSDYVELTDIQRFAADVNGNGKINSADRTLIARALVSEDHAAYKPFAWNT